MSASSSASRLVARSAPAASPLEPTREPGPAASVIVIARNEEANIAALLEALRCQTLAPGRFETLLVDDGSTDRTVEVAQRSGIAEVLRTPGGRGDAARNVALERARGEVLAITDADCIPAPDWLERGLEELDSLAADLLAGHIEVPLSTSPSIAEKLDYARFLDQERAVREIACGATANLFVRRMVFDRIGPFNDRLFAAGDIEFGMRATRAGFRIAYSPRAVVIHPPSRTAAALISRCYRGGLANAHLRRFGVGPAARAPIIWLHPGAYRPSRRIYGIERLYAAGYRPSRAERLRLTLGQWLYAQLPIVAGSLVGTFKR